MFIYQIDFVKKDGLDKKQDEVFIDMTKKIEEVMKILKYLRLLI